MSQKMKAVAAAFLATFLLQVPVVAKESIPSPKLYNGPRKSGNLGKSAMGQKSQSHAQSATGGILLDFEGLDDLQVIDGFYLGLGVDFAPNFLALIDADAGGSGNFGNNPSGVTVAFWLEGGSSIINVAVGFVDEISTCYASYAQGQGGFAAIEVYAGLNATGALLGVLPLPDTPAPYEVWYPVSLSFDGIARSVQFVGVANYTGFDDIAFGVVGRSVSVTAFDDLICPGLQIPQFEISINGLQPDEIGVCFNTDLDSVFTMGDGIIVVDGEQTTLFSEGETAFAGCGIFNSSEAPTIQAMLGALLAERRGLRDQIRTKKQEIENIEKQIRKVTRLEVEKIKKIDEKLKKDFSREINRDVIQDNINETFKNRMDREYEEILSLQEAGRTSSNTFLESIDRLMGEIDELRVNIDETDLQLVLVVQGGAGSDHDLVRIDGAFIDAELADEVTGGGTYASGINPESIELRINDVLVGEPLQELILVGISTDPALGNTSLKLQYRPRLDLLYFSNQLEIKFKDYADNEGIVSGDFSCGE